jgi:hypothetical protein
MCLGEKSREPAKQNWKFTITPAAIQSDASLLILATMEGTNDLWWLKTVISFLPYLPVD